MLMFKNTNKGSARNECFSDNSGSKYCSQ